MKKTEFPTWFSYKVILFSVDRMEEIHEELIKRRLDASDIINIIHDPTHDRWYQIFCREKVS